MRFARRQYYALNVVPLKRAVINRCAYSDAPTVSHRITWHATKMIEALVVAARTEMTTMRELR